MDFFLEYYSVCEISCTRETGIFWKA